MDALERPASLPAVAKREAGPAPPQRVAIVGSYTLVTFRGWLVEDMVAEGHTVFACAPDLSTEHKARLARAGANYQHIRLERTSLNPLHDVALIHDLSALFRRLAVDVVVAHTTKAMIAGCLAARIARVPRIFAIVEGLGYAFTAGTERKRRFVRTLLRPAMKAALACCDAVFVINNDDRQCLMSLGILSPQQKVKQIAGTGLDLDHYAYVPSTPDRPKFLLIGRVVRDKGIFEYVNAARVVRAKHPTACFRLIGPIDEHPTAVTASQVEKWEREGIVKYMGVTDDVRPHLADCTAYVLPSFREGMPRTVMEAMATGRPVIATDVPGCRDIVRHGVSGFLVPPGNVQALADAVVAIVESSDDQKRAMGLSAREFAELHFPRRQVNQEVISVVCG